MGSVVTEMVRGKAAVQAQSITQRDVLTVIDGLPQDHEHCATLAVNAVKEAVKNYLAFKREPWKKVYKKR